MKTRIRRLVVRGAGLTGALALWEGRMGSGLTVLTYHRVLPDPRCRSYPLGSLAMPESAFRAEVRWLSEHSTSLPLGGARSALGGNPVPRRPLIAITFDDGYRDNHEIAAPILEEFGLRATFFVTAGLIGTDRKFWFDRAAEIWSAAGAEAAARAAGDILGQRPELKSLADWMDLLKRCRFPECLRIIARFDGSAGPPPADPEDRLMTRDQVVDLHRRGHEIGSHSFSHPILTRIDDRQVEEEVGASRRRLEEWTGGPVAGFCYPNGDHDERTVRELRAAGYSYACTTREGRFAPADDPFLIPRLCISPHRVLDGRGAHQEAAFRAELCQFHRSLGKAVERICQPFGSRT